MKRSNIYLRDSLSEKEFILLKKDLIDHSVQSALKIKNLDLPKEQIEIITRNAVERVLFTYKFGKGGSLGDLVKNQVMADLRLEFERSCPDKALKVLWPDLAEKKPFDKLQAALHKLKALPDETVANIFEDVNDTLNGRQQRLLSTLYNTSTITYSEICKQFGNRGVMTYREIKIIYTQLLQTLKFLEVEI